MTIAAAHNGPWNIQTANNGCRFSPGRSGICNTALGPVVFSARVAVTGLPFGVTEAGVSVQVASAGKPEQLTDTGLLKPPVGVIVKVKVAVSPALILAVDGLEATVKSGGATPFPLSPTTCCPAASLIVIAPTRAPVAAGVNVTVMVQLPPVLTVEQLFVSAKSPDAATFVISSVAAPLFVTVTVLPMLVVPTG